MADFAFAAATNTVGNLATEYTSPYVSYFFHFDKIVDDFKKQQKALELKKERVDNDVDEAKRQSEIIEKDVQEWLKSAEKELGEAQTLEDEIERHKCFNWCPNWGWRYCLSKKVAKKTTYISKLLETPDFPRVGLRPPLQGIEFLLSQDFMASESSNVAFNGIMKTLNSDGVNMIGLYGMAGVGKTTLVKAVGKLAGQQKLFDTVVMVTMSQTPNIKTIQDKIAEILGLNFGTTTEEGKAEELRRRLKGDKKILIIVDDVWEKLELQTIGIPFGSEHEGCKILLTTRLEQVCIQMNCQEKIQLNILEYDEAWALFKDKASLKDASPSLIDVAKEVADECKGLPLAIVTIGEALKGESLDGWKAANKRLKKSMHPDNEDVCGGIYKCLKFSYDYLKGENIRSCLLLCSLFPEDSDIPTELLVMLGIGHRLFCELSSIEDLRRQIRVALTKLQKSGLLLETDDEESVRMHDVVRDFAHWLTSKGEDKYMVKDGLTEWPKLTESFGCYEAISLWNCDISNFPEKLEFSKLKTLILDGKDSLRVPSTFFEGMKALTVLFLTDVIFSLEALQYLTNVRTLFFVSCQLENISSAWRYMKNLEILALWKTNIQELPEELEGCGLKLLYFSCSEEQYSKFPPKLRSRFASLQELHVTSENNVNISEVNSLSGLTLRVSTDQCCQKNYVFPKLERYNIAVNEDPDLTYAFPTGRTLEINEFSSSSLSVFENLFYDVEMLTLKNISTEHGNLVPDVDRVGLNELTFLNLAFCEDFEYLIDTTQKQGPTTAFSNLVTLKVKGMTYFKGLCHGQPPMRFLQKLETLTVDNCPKLQWVFLMDEMTNITTIKAELEENQAITLSNLSCLELKSLPELRSIWKGFTHLVNLQSLTTMTIWDCDKLACLFSSSVAQTLVRLEELEIINCDSLEHLITEAENEIVSNMQHHSPLCWSKLKTLKIINCERLKYVFPMTLALGLSCLESLEIHNCVSLERLITEAENEDEIVSNMQHHSPMRWPKLKNHQVVTLQAELKGVHAYKELLCNAKNLTLIQVMYHKNLIPNVDPEGLNELAFLKLEDGKELECLIDTNHQGHVSTTAFVNLVELVIKNMSGFKMLCNGRFPKGYLQSLEKLEIRNCMEMVSLSPGLQNLNEVKAINCGQLQEIFQIDEESLHDPKEKQAVLKNYTIQKEVQLQENQAITLSNLSCLELKSLPELRCIWKGSTHLVNLQSLTTMTIWDCDKLAYLFSPSVAQTLVRLEELEIINCDSLEHLITEAENEDEIVSNMQHHSPLCWSKLKTLKIINCERLKYVFSMTLALGLLCLESLEIIDSPQLMQVFKGKDKDGQDHIVLQRLKFLRLKNLINLSRFCPENIVLSLSCKTLEVRNCPLLTCFENHQGVTIMQAEFKGIPLYAYKGLVCNAKNLIPNVDPEGLNELAFLRLYDGKELECLIDTTHQGYVSTTAAFLNLVELVIENMIGLKMLCNGRFPKGFLQKLEKLNIRNCMEMVSLSPGLQNLKEVKANNCGQLQEVFQIDEESLHDPKEKEAVLLSTLTHLELESLPELKFIWKGPTQYISLQSLKVAKISHCNRLNYLFSPALAQSLMLLETLKIDDCDGLEHITNELESDDEIDSDGVHLYPPFLPKLTTLVINDCPALKYVFQVPLAQYLLPQLESVSITNSPQLKQVFILAKEKNGVDRPFALPRLQRLLLENLINLSCFCSENYLIASPTLKVLNFGTVLN